LFLKVDDRVRSYDADPSVIAAVNRPDYVSPLDDLAFEMYQDPEISQIIKALDKKKIECVLAENYDDAKKLKQAINELYKIGERLARYDIEKRQAIEDEDYEKAKLKKAQMQEYRAETYRQLQKHNLLDFLDVSLSQKTKKLIFE
jgi:centrosomal protein CEP104